MGHAVIDDRMKTGVMKSCLHRFYIQARIYSQQVKSKYVVGHPGCMLEENESRVGRWSDDREKVQCLRDGLCTDSSLVQRST